MAPDDAAKAEKKSAAVLAKIAKMPAPHAETAKRLHAAIMRGAPALEPTWKWGLPFYRKDGKDLCYFRPEGDKYMLFGVSGEANVGREPGATDMLIASAWFFTSMDGATEARIEEIVRKAFI